MHNHQKTSTKMEKLSFKCFKSSFGSVEDRFRILNQCKHMADSLNLIGYMTGLIDSGPPKLNYDY